MNKNEESALFVVRRLLDMSDKEFRQFKRAFAGIDNAKLQELLKLANSVRRKAKEIEKSK